MSGSAAGPGGSAGREFRAVREPGAVGFPRGRGCRDGHGWPEPRPQDHRGESLLSCHSGCSASGKTYHHNFLKNSVKFLFSGSSDTYTLFYFWSQSGQTLVSRGLIAGPF